MSSWRTEGEQIVALPKQHRSLAPADNRKVLHCAELDIVLGNSKSLKKAKGITLLISNSTKDAFVGAVALRSRHLVAQSTPCYDEKSMQRSH